MKKRTLVLLLLCLLLTSCGAAGDTDSDTQMSDFTVTTAAETFPWIDSIDAGDWLGMNELYMEWTQGGNPDFYEDAVSYEMQDAEDVLAFHLQDAYTTADEYWALDITPINKSYMDISEWGHLLNLEKWENGEWERQCVLWDYDTYWRTGDAYTKPTPNILMGKGILISGQDFQIEVSRIYQAPEAGQYRFIFYVAFRNDGETEYRQYYIPFEVTE